MKLITKEIQKKLEANRGKENADPVVKFFTGGAATWLISELGDNGIAFGFCDLGHGYPELGYVDLNELVALGKVERDLHFKGTKPMSDYVKEANAKGRISA